MSNLIGQSLGRYHILEQLGEGGMATVYKAYDTRLERDVAIKVIRREVFSPLMLDRVLKRFEREAKALAKLSHPNIVHIHDYGEYQGSPYLVMEYLPGGTLKKHLGTPVPWKQAVHLLLPVARALQFAHREGIVHRDIKPSNILITLSGEPMLSDFGIAKLLEHEDTITITSTGVGVGTPEYMAPEQGMGKGIDARADIYSLGVVFYELITAHKPFTADTPMAVILKHMTDPLPRPQKFVPDLPESVEKVLIKALAKNLDERFADMGVFITAMENLVGIQTAEKTVHSDLEEDEGTNSKVTYAQGITQTTDSKLTFDQMAAQQTAKKESPSPRSKPGGIKSQYLVGGLVLGGVLLLCGLGGILLGRSIFSPIEPGITESVPTQVEVSSYQPTLPIAVALPSDTLRPTDPPPPTAPIATTEPRAGETEYSGPDNMVVAYIPSGEFSMGSSDGYADEAPIHRVYLDGFWMDQTEVTNNMYRQCVQSGACNRPSDSLYYSDADFGDSPVVYVSWSDARSYCTWAGRRLPTEAEWEKAARGTDGRVYPWGDSFSCRYGNFDDEKQYDKDMVDGGPDCDGFTSLAPVGSFPSGESPYGILDMAGNVWEWVSDWYSNGYYRNSPSSDPEGPSSGSMRVIRGGSWNMTEVVMRTTNRLKLEPFDSNYYVGFRCVTDAP
jgi:formylglycine-generating enzyme required for sulfatase activity/tRNA A-37 threonylcarbamoyl transferase component Bud32